jgi:N-acetylglutamate synthase-like GNAT family acetyltransferase
MDDTGEMALASVTMIEAEGVVAGCCALIVSSVRSQWAEYGDNLASH